MQAEIYLRNSNETRKITLIDVTKKDIDTWTSVEMIDFPYAAGRLLIPFSSISYVMLTNA
jgi:hypothetical protein